MKMRVAMIFSFFVFFINGNIIGSSTQNSLDMHIKETEIADIRLDVNVMKRNYHDLLKRVMDNENTIDLLEKDKQYLTHEVENLKRQLSCEIEVLHNITGEHKKELNETDFDLNYSFNKTVREMSYNVDVLENKFLRLELERSEESIKRCTNKTEVVSVCTFETKVEEKCVFYNDETGLDKHNWRRHQGRTGSPNTGPSKAMAGNYYMYIESGSMGHLENARLVSNILQQGVKMCLSFYYHMYGSAIGILEVIVTSSGVKQTMFTRSGNQGDQWYYKKLYIQSACNLQIIFNSIDGQNSYGDIALDNIMLFAGECGPQTIPP
ncbi:MAM and LDL-receptor class A domain-containing protein 1-like [Mytilus trossulus]|uniref:MAM and LDL-receptor class A domain-containing protein 1-like n=1 Tax=Mytilus trossulus TaxID=6551 RepID=UPI003006BAB2